jgi:hypothetical protein
MRIILDRIRVSISISSLRNSKTSNNNKNQEIQHNNQNKMPPKKKQNTRNVALEAELVRLGVERDAVLEMTREEQGLEYDRLQGLAPRAPETAFAQFFTDNQQQAAAAAAATLAANLPALPAPPAPPAPPAIVPPVAPPQTAHDAVQQDHPMDVDAPANDFENIDPIGLSPRTAAQIADNIYGPDNANVGNPAQDDHPMGIDLFGGPNQIDPNGQNPWLLQQPAPLPRLLGPISPALQGVIETEPAYERRRVHLQAAYNDQWRFLVTPPTPPMTIFMDHPLPPDVQLQVAYLPRHLQAVLSISVRDAQRQRDFLLRPSHDQHSFLYQRYIAITRHTQDRILSNRQRIDLDPMLLRLPPALRHWLHNRDFRFQGRWLRYSFDERLEILRTNGMLAWRQQMQAIHYQMEQERLAAQQPQPVPDHLSRAEDLARYNAGFGIDYPRWWYSAERAAWIEDLRRSGQL